MAFEVGRTATNLIELEHPEKRGRNRQNPMNYEEWSKSIELDRTVTPKLEKREQARQTESVPFLEGGLWQN